MKYLCVVIDRNTKETLDEYEVVANNEYYARHRAADMFRESNPNIDIDWAVDSMELEEAA